MAAPNWNTIPLATGLNGDQHGDMHGRTLKIHKNVLNYGATGDGVTDDAAAIQAAINAASANGEGWVFFPPGNYRIGTTLTLNSKSVTLTGAMGTNSDPSPGTWVDSGVRIFGTLSGSLIERTSTADQPMIIEKIGFQNFHATGTCITLNGVAAPGGIRDCHFRGHKGIVLDGNIFNAIIFNCKFNRGGAGVTAGSFAVSIKNHSQVLYADIAGYAIGVKVRGGGVVLLGGRYETCIEGINFGGEGNVASGLIAAMSFEACDYGINLNQCQATTVEAVGINGTANAPSGASIAGILTGEVYGVSCVSCHEAGSFSTGFVRVDANALRNNLTFLSCRGTTWSLADRRSVQMINCAADIPDIVRSPVIATGSLPAAAAAEDGRLVIEDNGAGDRNLIIYAGGQRFRIDGGAAV